MTRSTPIRLNRAMATKQPFTSRRRVQRDPACLETIGCSCTKPLADISELKSKGEAVTHYLQAI